MTNLICEDAKRDLHFTLEGQVMEEFSFLITILLPIVVPTLPVFSLVFLSIQVRFRFNIENSSYFHCILVK